MRIMRLVLSEIIYVLLSYKHGSAKAFVSLLSIYGHWACSQSLLHTVYCELHTVSL